MRKTLHTIAFTLAAILFLTTLSFLGKAHIGFKGSDKFLAEIKNIFPELSLDNAEVRFLPQPHLYFNKLAYESQTMIHEVKFIPGLLQGYTIEAAKLTFNKQSSKETLNYTDSFRNLRTGLIEIDNIVKTNSGIIQSIYIKEIILSEKSRISDFHFKQSLNTATIDFSYNDQNIADLKANMNMVNSDASSFELSIYTDLLHNFNMGKSQLDLQVKALFPYDSVFTCVSFKVEKFEGRPMEGLEVSLPKDKNPYLSSCFELQEYSINPGKSAIQINQDIYNLKVSVDNRDGNIRYKPKRELLLDLEPTENFVASSIDNVFLREFSENLALNLEITSLEFGLNNFSLDMKAAAISEVNSLKFKDNRVILKSKVRANPSVRLSDFSIYFAGSSLTTDKVALITEEKKVSLYSDLSISLNPSLVIKDSSGYLNGKLTLSCKDLQLYQCNNRLSLYSDNIVMKSSDVTEFYNSISPTLSAIWSQESEQRYTKFSEVSLGMEMKNTRLKIVENNIYSDQGSFQLSGYYDIANYSGLMQLRVLPFSDGNWYSKLPIIKGVIQTALKATMELGVVFKIEDNEVEIKDVSIGSALNEINEALINR